MLLAGLLAFALLINLDAIVVFTGSSERFTRKELAEQVQELGGPFSPRMTKTVDYLIVCADGNRCWVFACYGRKVEYTVTFRKQESSLLIVHEYDYWDALQEHG